MTAHSDTCPAGLREELAATRVEAAGIVYYDVIDPASGREFRFYEHEYQLARQLRPGRQLTELAAWVHAELGFDSSAGSMGTPGRNIRQISTRAKPGPSMA